MSDRKLFGTVYKDRRGEWRWRVFEENSKILAVSSEGYKNRDHAARMLAAVCPVCAITK